MHVAICPFTATRNNRERQGGGEGISGKGEIAKKHSTNMFDGVPEQFHQFIASRASSSPLHLPPLSAFTFHGFDPFPNPNPSPPPPPPPPPHQQLHFLHHPSVLLHHKDVEEEEGKHTVNFDVGARADRPILGAADHGPWSNEEVVALLRIGSSMENWFPEFTWEHASRWVLYIHAEFLFRLCVFVY